MAVEKQKYLTKSLLQDALLVFGDVEYVDVHGKGDKHRIVLRFSDSDKAQSFINNFDGAKLVRAIVNVQTDYRVETEDFESAKVKV